VNVTLSCGRNEVGLSVPDDSIVYRLRYPESEASAEGLVLAALRSPLGRPALWEAVRGRADGDVVVVVSDVTRPVPYPTFLRAMLEEIESAGVQHDQILILIATGLHRPATKEEERLILGEDVADAYRVASHDARDEATLVELPGKTWAGARVRLDRRYVEAGYRIITGLVEPHFMAGFSGGRKAVCPGLSCLETIRRFHGEPFLSDPLSRNGVLEGNPLHMEALSVARIAGVDFSLNVVMDSQRRVVHAFSGELEQAHEAACRLARHCACPTVREEADAVLTSCGGYPLDETFYQCVKGFVSCIPAVRCGGAVLSFGGCGEGIGSREYGQLMRDYAGRWREFLEEIKGPASFVRDQWELQMHARALEKVGEENLHFFTPGLEQADLDRLSVNGHAVAAEALASAVQEALDGLFADGARLAVIPDGPYCAPLPPAGA